MWTRKNKGLKDERIMKESNKLSAKMYYVIVITTIISLVIKIACKLPFYVYILEVIALMASLIYVLAGEMKKGILFIREKDEDLQAIHEEVLAKAMMIAFDIIIFGDLIFIFFAKQYFFWSLSYIAIWFIPALIITIASIKNGWIIWGGKKRETEGKQNLKKRVAIGALGYGVIVGIPFLYKDGAFHPEGILWMLVLAAAWGILFYVAFAFIMKVSEKKADKILKEKENQSEK